MRKPSIVKRGALIHKAGGKAEMSGMTKSVDMPVSPKDSEVELKMYARK
jgi:hypothetical protein